MKFFLLLLLVVMGEIATFIAVGSRIGASMTLLLVLASAVVGMWLVRVQGFATAMRAQAMLARNESPAASMLEGLALLVAGGLLILPGFLSDIVAFLLLIPPLRRWLLRVFLSRSNHTSAINPHAAQDKPTSPQPLEGQSRRLD